MEEEKNIIEKVKKETETVIEQILNQGIEENNLDVLYKLVDIHKDIANEEYWQKKKEETDMRYRGYSGEYGNYGRGGNYGEDSYGRRGVKGTGRGRYRGGRGSGRYGEEMMDDMYQNYEAYAEGREQYGRGNYGAKEDTMMSLEYMLESMVDFVEMLKQDASSQEEVNLIKKYTKQISEM